MFVQTLIVSIAIAVGLQISDVSIKRNYYAGFVLLGHLFIIRPSHLRTDLQNHSISFEDKYNYIVFEKYVI